MSDKELELQTKIDALTSDLESSKSYNEKLKTENIANRKKFSDVNSKLEEMETKFQAEKEDYKTMYEKSQEKLKESQDNETNSTMTALKKSVDLEVAKAAGDSKYVDVISKMVDINEGNIDLAKMTLTDLPEQLTKLKKDYKKLFVSENPRMNQRMPGFGDDNKVDVGSLKTAGDIERALKARVANRLNS